MSIISQKVGESSAGSATRVEAQKGIMMTGNCLAGWHDGTFLSGILQVIDNLETV